MQRETLETWARLGVGEEIAARGVQWRVGRTFVRGRQLFETHLPAGEQHFPPFVNISQSDVEDRLETRLRELGVPVLRGHRLVGLAQTADAVELTFDGPEGVVRATAGWVVGADGAHSTVRHLAGIAFPGAMFVDRFLIADIRADLPFTRERHFHFDPPWNPGRQVLLHPQPDGVWRIDWQVSPETDVEEERRSGRLHARIAAVIGEATPYDVVWLTGYRFSQRLADTFRVGRVLLAGDAAHLMSPFGARGLNSGIADAENLAWKLAAVADGRADPTLLGTYETERRGAAIENLAATDATMRFMAPHGILRRVARDLTLRLAPAFGWLRRRVNSGRLAQPARYGSSSVVAVGQGAVGDASRPGVVAPDVPLGDGRRLHDHLGRGPVVVVPPGTVPPDDIASVVVPPGSPFGSGRAWLVRVDGYVADVVPIERIDELGRSTPAVMASGIEPRGRAGRRRG
jgi:2-polyprenyl-6-methoxyphenol hydroxylase-like FAD-dependent oxidoreductase